LERLGRKHKGMVHVIITIPSEIYKKLKGYIGIYSSLTICAFGD